MVLGQTSFEIARDRNANTGTVRRRSDPTTSAVPLYRCVVELRPSNGQSGSYGRRPTLTDVSQKSSFEDIIRRSPRSSFMDSFRIVDKREVWNELQEARLAVVIRVWIASIQFACERCECSLYIHWKYYEERHRMFYRSSERSWSSAQSSSLQGARVSWERTQARDQARRSGCPPQAG